MSRNIELKCKVCGKVRKLGANHFPFACSCGMRIRSPQAEQAAPPVVQLRPGGALTILLHSLGINPGDCGCKSMAAKMNAWGVDGCRQNREKIVKHLKQEAKKRDWPCIIAAAAKAVTSGLALRINPLDPFGSLIDEAIRRAESTTANPSSD